MLFRRGVQSGVASCVFTYLSSLHFHSDNERWVVSLLEKNSFPTCTSES